MHPLEDTYWKTRVCISIRDGEKEAHQLDSNFVHHAHCAIIEDSIEDAAAVACMGLCGRCFDDMNEDQYHFLPRQHPDLAWAIMDPEVIDPTTQVMVHYAYELVDKNRRLEDQLKAQEATLKRYRQVIDEQRVSLNLPRMYEELPHEFLP